MQYLPTQPNLELKTRPKQVLESLPRGYNTTCLSSQIFLSSSRGYVPSWVKAADSLAERENILQNFMILNDIFQY
jgi:hypothetical protein